MPEIDLVPIIQYYADQAPKGAQVVHPMGPIPLEIYYYFPESDEAILIVFDPLSNREVSRDKVPGERARRILESSRRDFEGPR